MKRLKLFGGIAVVLTLVGAVAIGGVLATRKSITLPSETTNTEDIKVQTPVNGTKVDDTYGEDYESDAVDKVPQANEQSSKVNQELLETVRQQQEYLKQQQAEILRKQQEIVLRQQQRQLAVTECQSKGLEAEKAANKLASSTLDGQEDIVSRFVDATAEGLRKQGQIKVQECLMNIPN
ncbi:hypothetical protein NIES4106_61490 (plasmid) [Fischerella sp. NIES-4106]|nr:hypothetical protein NIES4106_61490 [Fischerella sp. NIES-4106]